MEFLQGESLAQRLERVRSLDYVATHRVVAHVARALTRAHAVGIVHRDLKPENIFLLPDDDGEMAKVLDFGVAKYSTEWAVNSVTKTGLLVGTPLYMSPEQARGTKEIDFRADLWALGVIAYQCLTGELPFVSEGLGDLLAKIMFEPIPVPSSIVPTIPAGFDAWWARASSRDANARFGSAKEMADSLAAALAIKTVVTVAAAPPGLREATMSDYNISTGESNAPRTRRSPLARVWPTTRAGKLLAAGVIGVAAIAGMMASKGESQSEAAQTLIAPSAPVDRTLTGIDPPAPALSVPPVNPIAEAPVVPEAAHLAPPSASTSAAPRPAPPARPGARPDSRRPLRAEDLPPSAPKPARDRAAPKSTAPPVAPKHVDFGI
jgi:serine/threonine protein kinase